MDHEGKLQQPLVHLLRACHRFLAPQLLSCSTIMNANSNNVQQFHDAIQSWAHLIFDIGGELMFLAFIQKGFLPAWNHRGSELEELI